MSAAAFLKASVALGVIEKFLASARQQLNAANRDAAFRREYKLRAEHLQNRLRAEERLLQAKRADHREKQK
jgi:hypothetical protein